MTGYIKRTGNEEEDLVLGKDQKVRDISWASESANHPALTLYHLLKSNSIGIVIKCLDSYPCRESCVTIKGGHSPWLHIFLHKSRVALSSLDITCQQRHVVTISLI